MINPGESKSQPLLRGCKDLQMLTTAELWALVAVISPAAVRLNITKAQERSPPAQRLWSHRGAHNLKKVSVAAVAMETAHYLMFMIDRSLGILTCDWRVDWFTSGKKASRGISSRTHGPSASSKQSFFHAHEEEPTAAQFLVARKRKSVCIWNALVLMMNQCCSWEQMFTQQPTSQFARKPTEDMRPKAGHAIDREARDWQCSPSSCWQCHKSAEPDQQNSNCEPLSCCRYTQHQAAADWRPHDSWKRGSNHPSSLWHEWEENLALMPSQASESCDSRSTDPRDKGRGGKWDWRRAAVLRKMCHSGGMGGKRRGSREEDIYPGVLLSAPPPALGVLVHLHERQVQQGTESSLLCTRAHACTHWAKAETMRADEGGAKAGASVSRVRGWIHDFFRALFLSNLQRHFFSWTDKILWKWKESSLILLRLLKLFSYDII